jgi:hypothetical protein
MTQRRPWVVPAVVVTLVLGNYAFHRVRPQWQRLRAAQARLGDAEETSPAAAPLRDLAALRRQVAELEGVVGTRRAEVERADATLASPKVLADLALRLARLARESGLQLVSDEASKALGPRSEGSTVPLPLGRALAEPPFARPLRTWRLRGSFGALRAFLDGLRHVPVALTRVSLERSPAQAPEQPLSIELELAL